MAEMFASRADIVSAVLNCTVSQTDHSIRLLTLLSTGSRATIILDTPQTIKHICVFCNHHEYTIRMHARIILINCVGMYPNRLGDLAHDEQLYKFLAELIETFVTSDEDVTLTHAKFISVYLGPLRRLSVIDVCRTHLMRHKILHSVNAALYLTGHCARTTLYAIEILQQFAFDRKILDDVLRKDEKLLSFLVFIISSQGMDPKWSETVRAAQYLAAIINGNLTRMQQQLTTKSSINNSTMNVRFSYSWEDKEIVKEMIHYLQTHHQVPVWHDMIGATGSAVECMMDGMRNANVVIVVVSRHYVMSPICKAELEVAVQLPRRRICYVVVEPSQIRHLNESWMATYMKGSTQYMIHGSQTVQGDMDGVVKFLSSSS